MCKRRTGLRLEDVAGSVHRDVSFWAIDESGNPSRKKSEDGKAFTVSAVTEISPIDYEKLLNGIPQDDGEIHFNTLYHSDPDLCIRLMTDLGKENILILSLTVHKNSRYIRHVRGIPRDELYLYALLKRILDAILVIDFSDTVIVTYDRTPQFRDDSCELMWTDRCVVVMDDSKARRLVQMTDLAASSIGKSELPGDFADARFFKRIKRRTVRIEELGGCTQQPPSAPNDTTDSAYKKHRPRSFLGGFFRKGGRQ